MKPDVYIILVNYNGYAETVACLESLLRLNDVSAAVAICDNNSSDGSYERIKEWANGDFSSEPPSDPRLRLLVDPPYPKPVSFAECSLEDETTADFPDDTRLLLFKNSRNAGYAGGINTPLRFLLRHTSASYFWLPNNDTLVHPDSLSAMLQRMKDVPKAGMCGSTIRYYHRPESIQAKAGGFYIPSIGYSGLLGAGDDDSEVSLQERDRIESRLDFILGASLLVSREFVEQVGLLDESLFLYFEELDWARRAKGRFRLIYAPDSVVYHKEGAAVGAGNRDLRNKSRAADYYFTRNRMLMTIRYHKWTLPSVLCSVIVTLARRIQRGRADRIGLILRAVLHGLGKRTGRWNEHTSA